MRSNHDTAGLLKRVVPLCQRLVQIPSLSGDEERAAELVQHELGGLGFEPVRRDGLGSVVGLLRFARPGPTVLFDAHLDVVPVTEPERWRHAPFGAERAEGRVWGRGATDIKGSLAAMVLALASLRGEPLAGTLVASASVGEEAMEGAALGRILDEVAVDRVVICEPTGLRLGLGHKGRASLVVEAAGRAAHTSRPDRGLNAVYRLMEALPLLRQLELGRDPLLGHGVMELVEIASWPFPGSSMVPYRCVARFDRRIVRGETREGVLEELRAALVGHEGVCVTYHQGELCCYTGERFSAPVFHPCWVEPPTSALVDRARRALRAAGQADEVCFAPYCTNGSESAGGRGIPTLIYGAGEIADAHVVDEGVDEAALHGAFWGYRALGAGLLARP